MAQLAEISAVCTHRRCALDADRDGTFACRCRGSQFDASGRVLSGAAKRDLPTYATTLNGTGDLVVHVGRPSAAASGAGAAGTDVG